MNLNKEKLQNRLCEMMCADVQLVERNNRLLVKTPFHFPDGDPYILYLDEIAGGLIRLSDSGHTLMHLSYDNDIDKLRIGNRGRLFEGVLANGEISEEDGELFVDVEPSDISAGIFKLSQSITSIYDLTFLSRSRVESTFYEDLALALENTAPSLKISRDYLVPSLPDSDRYPIDFKIVGKSNDLFVFGIPNKDKVRLTTIILGHLLRAGIQFESLMVFADQGTIPRSDLARLSNVGGEMVSSLDARADLTRKILKRAA